jgi:hypothetical protein
MEVRILEPTAYFAEENVPRYTMILTFIARRCGDLPVGTKLWIL